MARARVYRHDIRDPDCGSNRMRKDGHTRDQQLYRCGDCQRCYRPDGAYRRPGPAVKIQALEMYVAGASLSAIGRVVGTTLRRYTGGSKKGAAGLEGIAGAESAAY